MTRYSFVTLNLLNNLFRVLAFRFKVNVSVLLNRYLYLGRVVKSKFQSNETWYSPLIYLYLLQIIKSNLPISKDIFLWQWHLLLHRSSDTLFWTTLHS